MEKLKLSYLACETGTRQSLSVKSRRVRIGRYWT